ncbi:MAG: FtsQ-type POTRA domain-containing protein [Rectinema sp.]
MTDVKVQEHTASESRIQKKKGERSLLSVSDTYSVNILHATARRETSMPGTGTGTVAHQGYESKPKAENRKTRQAGKQPLTGRIAPATIALSASAEKLSEAVKPAIQPKKHTGIRLLMMVLVLCLLAAGTAITLPRVTKIETIRISGLETLSENAILASVGNIGNESLFSLKLNELERTIEQNPRVAHARAYRVLPSSLAIDIKERSAVASIMINSEQGTKLVLVDGEGIAFASIDAEDSRNPELPVVSGIQFEHFSPGQRLPDLLHPLFAELATIKQEAPELLRAFSEIRVERISGNSIELLLYPVHMKTAVRLPLKFSADALRNALVVLDILRSRGLGDQPSEIDFHAGTVVYQAKEAVSG